ncbi:MAG: DUF1801 domain-containing protein [Phycisphaerales bacterium JB040]
MATKPTTVKQYLEALPADRKAALEAIIEVVEQTRDPALEHGMQYGMPAWYVPHAVYPAGYHCTPSEPVPFASVASQKNHIGLYLFCTYTDPAEKDWFVEAWKATGKRLDMGASCVRVKRLEDVPLDVVARVFKRVTVKKFLKAYEGAQSSGQWSRKKESKKETKKIAKTAAKAAGKKTGKQGAAKKASSGRTVKKSASKKTAKKSAGTNSSKKG